MRDSTREQWLRVAFVCATGSLAALAGQFAAGAEPALPPAADRKVDFVVDIQPLFATSCLGCHGPKKQESAFRVDHKPTALKGGLVGPAIVPGKSAESALVQRVAGIDAELKMPPEGAPLSAEQIGLIRAWIDQGAEWPDSASVALEDKGRDHWAFKAPVRPPVPTPKNAGWSRTPVDAFVLSRLEGENLAPSPEADRVTLLRRLYLDLTGLPPTPAEVDAFVSATAPNAYEQVVEKLLGSPHYGERWARHWLDAARYADSDGYEKDKSRQIYFYRDYVIDAFNRDLPYDRFVIEQLAGDLLPDATQDQIVATGFLRNSMLNEEGGVDPEQFRMDAMFDRMDAIGKSVLGLTIQCGQCHAHKYDPLTQEEYYRLFAYLNNDHEASRVVYAPEERMKIVDVRQRIDAVDARLKETAPDWDSRLAAWEETARGNQPEWLVCQLADANPEGAQRYIPQSDHSVVAQGYAPTKSQGVFGFKTDLAEIRSFRLELLTDPNLPAGGPGRSFKGTCALTEFKVEAADARDPSQKKTVKLVRATADYANPETPLEAEFDDKSDKARVTGPVEFAIDEKDETAWGIDAGPGRRNQPRKAVFAASENVAFPGGTVLTFRLVQNHGGWNSDDHMNNNLGRFRLSICSAETAADPLPQLARDALSRPRDQRTSAQAAALFAAWRQTVPEWQAAHEQIEGLWREWPAGSTTLALTPRDEPRPTAILDRGDFLKPTRPVPAGTPAFLHLLPDPHAPANRLTFARWLVDRNAPTTARVFVNRVWQAYFGAGLVTTPEDFGVQGERPSHPELLDWLACEFMDRQWSVKDLHRSIVRSAVYRQSSRISPELQEKDPYNRLLARAPRLRVEGEVVRDIALAASGLLNPRVGGRSVYSPAPAFLFVPPASYGPFNWVEATGDERYRRAIYTFRRRSTPYPMLSIFDAPNGDFSCVRRSRSNTPLQALATLNETVFMDCARAMARRAWKEGGESDDSRLAYAFRLCVSRAPAPEETAELQTLLQKQRRRIAEGWIDAIETATGTDDRAIDLPAGCTPADLAVYTIVSRVLLNLDETITKE